MSLDKFNAEKIFSEVVAGRTPVYLSGRSAYFRHLTPFQKGASAYYYEEALRKCKASLVSTLEERLKKLHEEGVWTEENEQEFERAKSYLDGLRTTLKSLAFPSQIEEMKSQIADAEKKLTSLYMSRAAAVGLTAEQFADKKANERFVFDNLYYDEACTRNLFIPEEYDELSEREIAEVVSQINAVISSYADSYLKKVGLSRLVQDLIAISEGDAMRFYGVPAIKLTYYQIEMLNYGRWFKQIFSDPKRKPPAHVADDPDKLIEWSIGQENAANVLNAPGQNVAVVGVTTEDVKAVAGDNAVSMDSLIKKKGKMRGAEFAKALGYK